MKRTIFRFVSYSVFLVGISLSRTTAGQTQESNISFSCGSVGAQAATVATTPNGDEAIVIWENTLGCYTAQERCDIVSARFHRYFVLENMSFTKLVNVGGLPIICAVSTPEGESGCEGELFTVRDWDNAEKISVQMESVPWYIQGPISQSGSDYIAFDIQSYVLREVERDSGEALFLSQ
mgnify:FL=1